MYLSNKVVDEGRSSLQFRQKYSLFDDGLSKTKMKTQDKNVKDKGNITNYQNTNKNTRV